MVEGDEVQHGFEGLIIADLGAETGNHNQRVMKVLGGGVRPFAQVRDLS